MKKRLLTGLSFMVLVFIFSGVFVLHNLAVITREQKAKELHDHILDRYAAMRNLLKTSQAELYRHQAGHHSDINSLVGPVQQFENMLARTKNDYMGSSSEEECNSCHHLGGKKGTFSRELAQITAYLSDYKKGVNILAFSKDENLNGAVRRKATEDAQKVISIVDFLYTATEKTNESMEKLEDASINRARHAIVLAVIFVAALSLAMGVFLFRSITRPVNLLVRGVEKVSSGDYDSKVSIASADEIGYLAARFNDMTANLARVTGQKEALLRELRELNRSLEQRVQEATEQLRIAHEKMLRGETLSAVGTFASGVAHELATPLSSVLSYFQMVKGRIRADERFAGDLSLIEGELVRCRKILRGMLDFARAPETGKTPTNVNTIISGLLALLQYQKEYKGVTIVQKLDEGIPDVMAIPGQLKQVFLNIILNALQSMQGDGEITVSSSVTGEGEAARVAVRIADTGPGIPREELNKIFQPFYTTRESGTGLGLSISYGIIRAHGGDIEVKSEPGKGATFSVYLPVVINHEGHEEREADDVREKA
jgi:two-component system NtrC family sensor kinase